MKKVLYVRSGPYQVDPKSYNLQELGLARALYNYGYQCDIVYYHKKKNFDEYIEKDGVKIKILWRKGIRLLRSGIYPSILKKKFLKNYDVVICSEYSQIMSYLLSKRCENMYIYNGVYYNLFKIPFVEKIYDFLYCKKINKNIKCAFCKTKLAEEFIDKKGIKKTKTVGVGLDLEKFEKDNEVNLQTKEILDEMDSKNNILYIGSITDRKNVQIIIKAFIECCKNNNNIQLIIIGKGDKKYVEYCHSLVPESIKNRVKWFESVDNSQTKYIYQKADVFVLPSKQEIFGMVLLEAMYFGLPVISSNSAGGLTLINENNGVVIDNFEIDNWSDAIEKLLNDKKILHEYSNNASKTIKDGYMWNSIAEKMNNTIQEKGNFN